MRSVTQRIYTVAIVFLAVGLALVLDRSAFSQKAEAASQVGRYQISVSSAPNSQLILLDTSTGQVWSNSSGYPWIKEQHLNLTGK